MRRICEVRHAIGWFRDPTFKSAPYFASQPATFDSHSVGSA